MELTDNFVYDELVDECRNGQPGSLKKLYLKYAKAMFNTSLRIVNDRRDAEDILQDSFVSAFNNLGSFNNTYPFGTWLKKIVVNRSINCLREKKMIFLPVENTAGELEEDDNIYDDDTELKVEKIKKAVSMMPPGYRTVFSLHLLEGYDFDEISEILRISPSTVRTQYHRSKKYLINILKNK